MTHKLLLIFLSATFLLSSGETEEMIYHDNNYQLKWSDFKGQVEEDLPSFVAVSYVGFRFGYKGTSGQDSLRVVVETFFNPNTSWHKPDTTAYLLKHEQVHFDITELYTRKLKQQIQSATLTYKNYQQVMREMEKSIRADMNTADSIYDATTDNSRNTAEQKKWNTNIAEDLEKLKIFERDTFTVPVRL